MLVFIFLLTVVRLAPPYPFLRQRQMCIGGRYRYRPEGDMRTVLFVCAVSLGLHPAIVWTLGSASDLSTEAFRSAVLTASVAPGINAYVFANMYGVAKRVAASAVLVGTGLSILTTALWLGVLP